MNRFFRTAYATSLIYLCLALFAGLATRTGMPFPAFSCLYFGLLLSLLPGVSRRLAGKERLFLALGAVTAALGFLPLALFRCPAAHWLVHLLGTASAAVFLSLLRHRTTHSDFMAKYRFTVVMLLILLGFVYLSLLSGIYQDGQVSARSDALRLALNGAVPYAIVLLGSGVLLLRGLRAQEGTVDKQAFNRRQLRDALVFAALVTVIFAADPFEYLQRAVSFLFTNVLRPSARFLVQLLSSFLRLISVRKETAEYPQPTPGATPVPEQIPVAELAETEPEQYYVDDSDLSLAIAYIFLAAAAAVLLVILAYQVRKLVRNLQRRSLDRGSGYPSETRETLLPDGEALRTRKPGRRSGDPRQRMRYMYADFLRFLAKSHVRFGRTDTCGEIRRHAGRWLVTDASVLSAFTALYEKARYRMEEPPGEDDARRMKTLLDRIRKGP